MDSRLSLSEERIRELASRHGLPLHIYDLRRLGEIAGRYRAVAGELYSDTRVAFAVKANPCMGAVRAAQELGLGADTASEFELRACLEAGMAPEAIVANGNAKTDTYLRRAVEAGVTIAADSEAELDLLNGLGAELDRSPRVLLRISGLPVEGFTSADQTTAARWSKFGMHAGRFDEVLTRACNCNTLDIAGISAHVGTQLTRPAAFHLLVDRFLELAEMMRQARLDLRVIDLGGGWPVDFVPREWWESFRKRLRQQLRGELIPREHVTWDNLAYGYAGVDPQELDEDTPWRGKAYHTDYPGAEMLRAVLSREREEGGTVADALRELGAPQLVVEPGRSLFGPSGVTVAEVMGTKRVQGNLVVELDMGLTNHGSNLLSPDIFMATLLPEGEGEEVEAFLAGRLCFNGDMISKAKIPLHRPPERGDLLVLHHTGAYGADHFASHSCGFPLPAKVALEADGGERVWRRTEEYGHVFHEPGND